jgi:hypothetical protein
MFYENQHYEIETVEGVSSVSSLIYL